MLFRVLWYGEHSPNPLTRPAVRRERGRRQTAFDRTYTLLRMVILIAITVLSVVACYLISRARSANVAFWVVMALLFGPFAIPFALFGKPKIEEHRGRTR